MGPLRAEKPTCFCTSTPKPATFTACLCPKPWGSTLAKRPWEPALRQQSDEGCCLPSPADCFRQLQASAKEMKERPTGRLEGPEKKTQVPRCNRCGRPAPIPTARQPGRRSGGKEVNSAHLTGWACTRFRRRSRSRSYLPAPLTPATGKHCCGNMFAFMFCISIPVTGSQFHGT